MPSLVARVNGGPVYLQQVLPLAKRALDKVSVKDRDQKTPEILRRAVSDYVDRELLLQEALARGLKAETADVDWAYDQMRREYPDESAWAEFLAEQGLDAPSLRAELRVQKTVAVLLEQEVLSRPVPEAEVRAVYEADPSAFTPKGSATPPPFEAVRSDVEAVLRDQGRASIREALVARLRAKARIELYL